MKGGGILKITEYTVFTNREKIDLRLACVSDLHSRPYVGVLARLKKISPDAILLPGDIIEVAAEYMNKRNRNGLNFLRECAKIAPTYYTFGNHEIYNLHAKAGHSKAPDKNIQKEYLEIIKSYGVTVINDEYKCVDINGTNTQIYIGGIVCGRDKDPDLAYNELDKDFLNDFSAIDDGYKILLCHYPHYYPKYLKNLSFDLILSGHAHGGQWRIFGKGVFAPHQGLFPKYTSDIHDGRLIISRGVVNNAKPIPRFFNPCEILLINIKSQ